MMSSVYVVHRNVCMFYKGTVKHFKTITEKQHLRSPKIHQKKSMQQKKKIQKVQPIATSRVFPASSEIVSEFAGKAREGAIEGTAIFHKI